MQSQFSTIKIDSVGFQQIFYGNFPVTYLTHFTGRTIDFMRT